MGTCRTPAAAAQQQLLLLLLLLSVLSRPSCAQFPTQVVIKEWVEQMQQELVTLVETASGVKSFTQIFLNNRKLYSVETNYAGQLVASAARNIEKLLLKRSMALEDLKP